MSWLSKVSDLAGKAEDLLVRMDQNAGSAIAQVKTPTASRSSLNRIHTAAPITEEIGGRAEPSHAHSDYIKPQRRQQPLSGYAPSTSVLPEQRDANLISFLNDPESEEMEMRGSTFSVHSVTEASDLILVNNLRSQLSAKDSQIEVLKAKSIQLEKRLEEEKIKGKNALERLKKEDMNDSYSSSLSISKDNLLKEKNVLQSEISNLKKRVISQEEELSAINDQLRLAKFNLTENKKEFDEYKEKAHKILQTKEKLIESLKSESGGEEKSNSVLQAHIEELILERDMARCDLESAQVQLYNIRGEVDEAESATREAKMSLNDMKKRLEEERDAWNMNNEMMREKSDCARSELEVIRIEMEKERNQWQRRLDDKEMEITTIKEELKRKKSMNGDESGRTTLLLLQKEEELREVMKEKQMLSVKLERAHKVTKDTIVPIGDMNTSIHLSSSSSSSFIHSNLIKALTILRANRTARSYFIIYILTIHLLLFFIILTYTPESHNSELSSIGQSHNH